MNNVKQFVIWWAKDSTHALRKYWPEFQFKLLQFFDFLSLIMIASLVCLAIVAVIGSYVSTSGPWIYYSTLVLWAFGPVLYFLSRYFYFKWQEWQQEQARLLETLSRKKF